ncbi:hypothetical protein CHT99_17210 [Sphingobacterium cellulitidis]|nr:hypothetical protein CHT99_17210 [Sphingobacterium cellulitidis]
MIPELFYATYLTEKERKYPLKGGSTFTNKAMNLTPENTPGMGKNKNKAALYPLEGNRTY